MAPLKSACPRRYSAVSKWAWRMTLWKPSTSAAMASEDDAPEAASRVAMA